MKLTKISFSYGATLAGLAIAATLFILTWVFSINYVSAKTAYKTKAVHEKTASSLQGAESGLSVKDWQLLMK